MRELQAPMADGGNPAAPFDGYLCRAWGETELPCAEVVRDMAGVRRFIVREWLNDDAAPDLPKILEEIEADIEREKAWCISFEIGGASVEPVYSFAAHGAAAAAPADGTGRTPTDYALEHAEYLAKASERLLQAVNDQAAIRLRIAESDDVGDDDEFDANSDVDEALRAVRSCVYGFRTRRDRAAQVQGGA